MTTIKTEHFDKSMTDRLQYVRSIKQVYIYVVLLLIVILFSVINWTRESSLSAATSSVRTASST